ncbi:hypothetical protein GLYMA_12G234066v4 [Glycine max]|nr:hypothetical protein GLYMA_12G234066v4 [Glycine max]KAH1144598.1 hypothetical protein GYH30_034705 [Glycine max]
MLLLFCLKVRMLQLLEGIYTRIYTDFNLCVGGLEVYSTLCFTHSDSKPVYHFGKV